MESKECIICREIKNKNLFSEEHIIPDSLGGTIKILEVCKKCNEEMGKKLDYHLTDFISNRIYRKKYKISGKTGKIPEIIKNHTYDSKGRKIEIKTDENNNFKVIQSPLKEFQDDNRLQMLFQDGDNKMEKIIEGFREKAKANGKEIEVKITEVFEPPEKYNFKEEINLTALKMEFFKIAHEFLCHYDEDYRDSKDFLRNSSLIYEYIQKEEKIDWIENNVKFPFVDINLFNSIELLLKNEGKEIKDSSHIIFYFQKAVFLRIGKTSALIYNFYNKNNFTNAIIIVAQNPKEKAILFRFL